MNFFAMPTLKNVRACFRRPSSMMPRFSLKLTLARLRTGIARVGVLAALGGRHRRCRRRRRASSSTAPFFAARARAIGYLFRRRAPSRLGPVRRRARGAPACREPPRRPRGRPPCLALGAPARRRRAGRALAPAPAGARARAVGIPAVLGPVRRLGRPASASPAAAGASPSGPSAVTMIECGRPSGPLSLPRISSVRAPAGPLHGDLLSWLRSLSLGRPGRPSGGAHASTTSSM